MNGPRGRSGDPVAAAARAFLARRSRPGDLLVAVSGGGDSLGLLISLHEAAPHFGVTVSAATVDHRLRPGSAGEARAVAALCERLGIGHRILAWEGEKPPTGLQAAAREARYRLLAEAVRQTGAMALLAAHTLDDQIETVQMREKRAGPGQTGMAEATLIEGSIWLLRPFLGLRRTEIRGFLAERGVSFTDDPSNADPRFERARLRAGEASDPFDLSRLHAAEAARTELAEDAAGVIAARVDMPFGVVARLRRDDGPSLSEAETEALRVLVAVAGGLAHRPGRDLTRRIAGFVEMPGSGRMTAGRTVIEKRRESIFVYREMRGLPVGAVEAGRTAVWDGRWRIEVPPGSRAVAVGPARDVNDRQPPEEIPPPVWRRALRAEAFADREQRYLFELHRGAPGWSATRWLPLFDRFLPAFDLPVADAVFALFCRPAASRPPFRAWPAENADPRAVCLGKGLA